MKTSSIKAFALIIVIMILWAGCSKESHNPTVNDLSPYARNFLTLHAGKMNAMAGPNNAAINRSFQNTMGEYYNESGGSSDGSDSTIIGDPWQSCANITEFDNSDGSHTIITDYGAGCYEGFDDYKYFMMGKTIQTSRYSYHTSGSAVVSSYLYRYQYVNYGGRYYFDNDSSAWSINGNSSFAGESTYDTINQKFSGWFDGSDTTEYVYGKDSYSFQSLGKSHYDERKSVAEKNDYQYTSGDNYYKSVVTAPLVSDFTCSLQSGVTNYVAIWITYVSGHEVIQYRQDGQEGTFEIDYGNGDCDNRITVIENGKVITIDLVNDWAALAATGG